MRTRWICIGRLHYGGPIFLFGGGWQRCEVSIHWRGRQDWCQPWQFPDWAGLEWAVGRRLAIAGLAPLAYASRLTAEARDYPALWVKVERTKKQFRLPYKITASLQAGGADGHHQEQKT